MYIGQTYISEIETILKTCLYVIIFFNVILHIMGQESLKFVVLSSHSSYDTGLFLY